MTLRIGINGGGGHNRVDDAITHASGAAADGFPSYWLSQIFGVDALTTVAMIAREVPAIELGVAVVPTIPRHPTVLAVQAQTVQQVAGGRLVLGIGPSHAPAVEGMWGLDWSRPYSHTVEYLAILRDLLDGKGVNHDGELLVTRGQLSASAPPTPILVAGLGPRMLALAGERAEGTVTWMCGLQTLERHIVPRVSEAAQRAGRPSPRIVAGLPLCVTDEAERVRAFAAEKLAIYAALPSYRAMLDREGVNGPADICLIGDEGSVGESHRLGHGKAVLRRKNSVFAEGPRGFQTTQELNMFAQIALSPEAELAVLAQHRRVDGYFGSRLEALNAWAYGGDLTAGLVPEHDRVGSILAADAALVVVVHVASADTDGTNPYQRLAGPWVRRVGHRANFDFTKGYELQ